MRRRDFLELMVAAGAAGTVGSVLAACGQAPVEGRSTARPLPSPGGSTSGASGRMPALFLAHGSPMLVDDAVWMAELGEWAAALPRPRAILMLSAHWTDAPATLGATRPVPLVYDFGGFPARYYETRYPAPGAPQLAARVRGLLSPLGPVAEAPERGLDHGAYVPLLPMYPAADVPVLQMSLPSMDPARLMAIGRALAPLRDEGVLIVGSGFLTHNMRAIDRGPRAATPSWASELDAWAEDALARRDADAMLRYRETAPGVRQALPTHEHFVPVIVAMGASLDHAADPVTFPITGWEFGSFTRRSVQFG